MQTNKLVIGLFGFGVVGEGLYKVLSQTPGLNARIKKIAIRHPEKQRSAPADLFTTDPDLLLEDNEINVIIELIDDADAAYHIVTRALKLKKATISANKKMIAAHLAELIALQMECETPLLYEAACCASIPVIRNLEEYYDNDLLRSINGVVNGSTNYILTKMFDEGLDFATALKDAQLKGFAESNPALDIEGYDAANKLTILLAHAYGYVGKPSDFLFTGITRVGADDARYAREKGLQIKLVAQAQKRYDGKIAALVAPQFVEASDKLFAVKNEFNGVTIESSFADKQFFYGKGAGGFPTASAVLSDLSALRYRYRYEYKKLQNSDEQELATDYYLKVYVGCHSLSQIPHARFDRILSWNSDEHRCFVTGYLSMQQLIGQDWWKQDGFSLILFTDGIVEHYSPLHSKTMDNELELIEY